MTPFKVYLLLLTRLPIAWLAGIRLANFTQESCSIRVRHTWLSQNPFQSMFWAVQGMAAELSTGLLFIEGIRQSQKNISMLVIEQRAQFFKKAKGLIHFDCKQGEEIKSTIHRAIHTGEGQTIVVISEGKDEKGDIVSRFEFTWSLKLKKNE